MAMGVAAYETAQVLGWRSPVPDIWVSAIIVASLVGIFAYVFASTRSGERPSPGVVAQQGPG
jgi:hypothetical protein